MRCELLVVGNHLRNVYRRRDFVEREMEGIHD
jgi:hypothetical protein